MKNRSRSFTSTMIIAVLSAWGTGACAGSQRLACALTDIEEKPRSENRPVVVDFDEQAKTLRAEAAGHVYTFGKVLISNVTINGQAETVSLGIDRSSLGIVWQKYDAGEVHTEFGACQRAKLSE
jgi:hypothetical protein